MKSLDAAADLYCAVLLNLDAEEYDSLAGQLLKPVQGLWLLQLGISKDVQLKPGALPSQSGSHVL